MLLLLRISKWWLLHRLFAAFVLFCCLCDNSNDFGHILKMVFSLRHPWNWLRTLLFFYLSVRLLFYHYFPSSHLISSSNSPLRSSLSPYDNNTIRNEYKKMKNKRKKKKNCQKQLNWKLFPSFNNALDSWNGFFHSSAAFALGTMIEHTHLYTARQTRNRDGGNLKKFCHDSTGESCWISKKNEEIVKFLEHSRRIDP